ncbi:THUMP domain-containing class I SAM-dependent RNA methyltransferase [Loktanella sp. DJP18]|uniref:THUMP domain-containing class I SAM-dependent RNA methyltransferase n=1 Tax=Loktanella sp. DJP18 TaxID=3409788 RepID=UPI003BB624FD
MTHTSFEIFATAPPGLEPLLLAQVQAAGFDGAMAVPGGVTFTGGWPEVWRANLELRGAGRVLARFGSFLAFHLAQLDKRSRKFPWTETLRPYVPVRVEVTCHKSKIYHAGAAQQRIETALREEAGINIAPDAPVTLKVRIDDNTVTLSVDTSGESLHKRGHKEAVGKAPMRETLASLFLVHCGYTGTEAVVDPMCGSGTFVIEAAEIALGLQPGRSRDFAFMQLAGFDKTAFAALRHAGPRDTDLRFYGSDRDTGAVRSATANAERAGVGDNVTFAHHAISDLPRPAGLPGLVMVNPPYGARIGNRNLLFPLYGALGATLKDRFRGWRVGLVTSEPGLAKATALPFTPDRLQVPHGGLKVTLFRTDPL